MGHNRIGIVLAGGVGSRLYPITKGVSKQLLPIYDLPAIFYPINTLIKTGHKKIVIITKPDDKNIFKKILSSFKKSECEFIFLVQNKPKGLPDAFNVSQKYLKGNYSTLILGDNIIDTTIPIKIFSEKKGSRIFTIEVEDPHNYGVVEFDEKSNIKSLEEKPKKPKSNSIAIGLYLFDDTVVHKTSLLSASKRGELEIIDLLRIYKSENSLFAYNLSSESKWFDIGSFENLFQCNSYMRDKHIKQNKK